MKPRILASFLATMAFGLVSANAATVSFNDTTPVLEGDSLGSNIINLNKFNPALGTLTKVEITITLSVPSLTIVVDNDATSLANVTAVFGTIGSVFFNSSASTYNGFDTLSGSNFSIATQNSTFDVAATVGDSDLEFNDDLGPDNGRFSTTAVLVGQTTPRVIDSGSWSQYSGAGTVNLDVAVDLVTNVNLNSGGGIGLARFEGAIPSATFASTVTYTYTPVPEPSAVLLGGLSVLGLLRRRRH